MIRVFALLSFAAAAFAQPSIQSVANAADHTQRLCPGGLAIVTGNGLSEQASVENVVAGGRPAPILSTALGSVTVQLAVDLPAGNSDVTVTVQGQMSPALTVPIQNVCPTFYQLDGTNIFFNSSNVPFTHANPASPGGTAIAYMIGLGPTNPSYAAGLAANAPASTLATPTLMVGGQTAVVSYAGLAVGKPGVYQVTFTVPPTLTLGDQTVTLQIGNQPAPAATLAVSGGTVGITSVTNGATFQVKDTNHPAAPNSFVSIFASNLGSVDSTQNLFPATTYQKLTVSFNGILTPLYYVFPSLGQINLVLPAELPETGTATMTITNSQGTSQNFNLPMNATDVGVFRLTDPSNAARKNGAVLFGGTAGRVMPASMATALGLPPCTGKPATTICGQPATIGDTIQIYFTGGGKVTPNGNPSGVPLATGQLAPADGSVLYETLQVATVRIGTVNAQVLFSGIAPGNAGLYQVNAIVPVGSQLGDDVPVIVALGGTSDTVTIAVH
jgi:uncharacterized protein (TIGR03437 family)